MGSEMCIRDRYGAASRSLLATVEYLVDSGKLEIRGKEDGSLRYHIVTT